MVAKVTFKFNDRKNQNFPTIYSPIFIEFIAFKSMKALKTLTFSIKFI